MYGKLLLHDGKTRLEPLWTGHRGQLYGPSLFVEGDNINMFITTPREVLGHARETICNRMAVPTMPLLGVPKHALPPLWDQFHANERLPKKEKIYVTLLALDRR